MWDGPAGTARRLRRQLQRGLLASSTSPVAPALPRPPESSINGSTSPASAPAPQTNASAPQLASIASVTTAFGVGWLLAELLPGAHGGEPGRLPEGSMTEASTDSAASLLLREPSAAVRVRQVQSKLNLLQPELDRAGVPADFSRAVTARLAKSAAGGSLGPQAVLEITESILADLTVASTRLGRAMSLGFDLARSCRLPADGTQADFVHLFASRIVGVQEALADLASSLPEHAARSVSLSLAQWQYWAANPKLGKRPVVWPHVGVRDALARQGQVWRAVLSGEKLGKDMLAADDYFLALKTLARRLFTSRPVAWILLAAFAMAAAGGIYLLVAQNGFLNKLGGTVLSGLGVVGVSAASLKRSFADVAKELEAQVWGAELDFAIAQALTVPPGDWRVKLKNVDRPPPRGLDPHIATNARVVYKLASVVSDRRQPKRVRARRVDKLLSDDCRYQPLSESAVSEKVAACLVRKRFLGSDPEQLAAGAPGRLVSLHHDARADIRRSVVWTFSHGRLAHLREFADYAAARDAAHNSLLDPEDQR